LRTNTEGNDTDTDNKPLFFDGTIGIYQYDANNDNRLKPADNDKVYLFIASRRGGSFVYALDVSDRNNPKYLWRVDSSVTGFSEIGESWSEPKYAKIQIDVTNDSSDNKVEKDVVIFGAGYDATADDVRASTYADEAARIAAYTKGRGIFIVDMSDGSLLTSAGSSTSAANTWANTVSGMDYSIPGDISIIDSDQNGYSDRLYFGDTGANVWRVDIGDYPGLTVNKVASLGGSGTNARKILYHPDVVYATGYTAVLLGTGDREDPFDGLENEDPVVNRFYMFRICLFVVSFK